MCANPLTEPRSLSLHAPAKINLVLAITGTRDDGFHDLVSLVAPVAFGDTLHVTLHGGGAVGKFNREDRRPSDGSHEAAQTATERLQEAEEEDVAAADRSDSAAGVGRSTDAAEPAGKDVPNGHCATGDGAGVCTASARTAANAPAVATGPDILHCDAPGVPTDGSNLVLKAASAFRRQMEKNGVIFDGYFEFTLDKKVPAGAGLGGGSSDAATALSAMNSLSGAPLPEEHLYALAAEIGSDCPLFLARTPVVMTGRGEKLTFIGNHCRKVLLGHRVLLFKPSFSVNTGWAYGQMRAAKGGMYVAAKAILGSIQRWEQASQTEQIPLFNNMQTPVFEKYVALPALLDQLRSRFPGLRCMMSGSGSACFALLEADTPPETVAVMKAVIRNAWGADAFCEETTLL